MNKKCSTVWWYENFVYVLAIIVFSFLLNQAFTSKQKVYDGMQSMTFPKVIFSIIIFLCVTKLILNIIQLLKHPAITFEMIHPKMLISLLMIIAYAALWEIIGFGISSLVYISLESKLLRQTSRWRNCFFVSLGATAVLYFIFGYLFNVDFPEPLLSLIF